MGGMTRRDVWLEHSTATGVFRLRWRVGQYPETEELFLTYGRVLEMLDRLVGKRSEDGWKETFYLDEHGTLWDYLDPTDAEKAIENYLAQDDEESSAAP